MRCILGGNSHPYARALTNTNFKILAEQFGLRGRQDHYDSYAEDFIIRQQQDGGEVF